MLFKFVQVKELCNMARSSMIQRSFKVGKTGKLVFLQDLHIYQIFITYLPYLKKKIEHLFFGPLLMLEIIIKVSLQINILSYTSIIPPSIIILELLHCKSKDYSNCPI